MVRGIGRGRGCTGEERVGEEEGVREEGKYVGEEGEGGGNKGRG